MQTSSSSRHTNLQHEVRKAELQSRIHDRRSGGELFNEHAIHPMELLISVMERKATSLM